jgi:hypothetical protein
MTANSLQPEDVLTHLIVTVLTPMFLATTGGDLALARAAATHTVNAYTARNPIDLLLIAQTIALGLAVLSSVSLSMAENIPISLILRLRGNAASLHRAADASRCALGEPAPGIATPLDQGVDIDQEAEAAIIAEVTRTQARAAAYQASFARPALAPISPAEPEFLDSPPTMKAAIAAIQAESQRRIAQAETAMKSTGTPIPHAAPTRASPTEEERRRSAWSSAMADVAREMTAELATLPAAERRATSIRVAALSSTANALISGVDPYQSR